MSIHLEQCTVLGGCGYPFRVGQRLNVRFGPDAILLEASEESTTAEVFYPEVVDLSITGPGTVTTGGGFIGGGFGVEGALQGMAVATVLNLLTNRSKVHTFVQIVSHQGEVFLHSGGLEPGALRIALSPVFTRLRRFDPDWLDARLQRLQALRSHELISEEQLDRFKARLLSASRFVELESPDLGTLATVKCQSCGANVYEVANICDVCGKSLG